MKKRQVHTHHSTLLPSNLIAHIKQRIRTIAGTFFVSIGSVAISSVPTQSQAQNTAEPSYLGNSKYLEITVGTGLGRLRDFATSPLYYTGPMQVVGGALTRLSLKQDISTGISVLSGKLTNDYNGEEAQSNLTTFSAHHTRLYQIFSSSPEKWNFKVGGEANVTANLRTNPAFRNSAVGIEAFPVIYGTFKAARDLTRTTGRRGKEPKKKSISLTINASVLSASYRNGYSYLGIGQVIDKQGFDGLLDGYRFKFFGVNSLSTSLDYTLWLKNKNGWRFSYAWDAYMTRNDYAEFEMATHTLRVALLFNTKSN